MQIVDVADVAVLQERIGEHGGQRRRHRHGQAPVGAVAFEAVHHFQQRDIGFGDGLVEPVFLEEIVVLGMADEGQMGVQDQTKITERHGHGFPWRGKTGRTGVDLRAGLLCVLRIGREIQDSWRPDPRDSEYLIPRLGKGTGFKPRDEVLRIPRMTNRKPRINDDLSVKMVY